MANRGRNRRRPSRNEASENGRTFWLSLFAFIAVVGAGGTVAYLYFTRAQTKFDDNTHCIVSRAISAHTVVLVDETDTYSERQMGDITKFILKALPDTLAPGEMLSVVKMSGGSPPSIPTAMTGTPICRPFRSRQELYLAGLPVGADTSPNNDLEADYLEFREKEIPTIAKDLFEGASESPDSQIFEYLKDITFWNQFQSIVTFQGKDFPLKRRVIIISDLLQYNKPDYELDQAAHETYQAFSHTPYGKRMIGTGQAFAGIEVTVLYVKRNKYATLQNEAHRTFWEDYLKGQGAKLQPPDFEDILDNRVKPVPGSKSPGRKKHGPA